MTLQPRQRKRNNFAFTSLDGNLDTSTYGDPVVRSGLAFREFQQTWSEGHNVKLLGKTEDNIGGEFQSRKVEISLSLGEVAYKSLPGPKQWYGSGIPVFPAVNSLLLEEDPIVVVGRCEPIASASQMRAWGATLISRCKPLSPVVDLASALGELKDGLPSIPAPGNLGSEYLNVVFGIVPTVSDLQKLRTAAENSEKLLKQLNRDSGKRIRRSAALEETVTVSRSDSFGAMQTLGGITPKSVCFQPGYIRRTIKRTKETWFSGAFMYYLPEEGTVLRKVAELDALYGIRPGLDTFWNLTGWSWMADWFGNFGDVFENISSFSQDGLMMQYGYVMHRQVRTEEYDYTLPYFNGSAWEYLPVTATVKFTTLQRRPGNPFGFGVSLPVLTGRQVAILAALGISRA